MTPHDPRSTLGRLRASLALACLLAHTACASSATDSPAPDAAQDTSAADTTTTDAAAEDVAPPRDASADLPRPDVALDAATDAAARRCTSQGDCPAGTLCQFAMGCDQTEGTCRDNGCQSLPMAPQYCGCDGRTIQQGSACLPARAWRSMGACPAGG